MRSEFQNLPFPLSPVLRIRIFSIPDPGSASKNLSILTQKLFLSSKKYDPGCSSRIRILIFYPSRIPDPGVKKAPDPGSGSATLSVTLSFFPLSPCFSLHFLFPFDSHSFCPCYLFLFSHLFFPFFTHSVISTLSFPRPLFLSSLSFSALFRFSLSIIVHSFCFHPIFLFLSHFLSFLTFSFLSLSVCFPVFLSFSLLTLLLCPHSIHVFPLPRIISSLAFFLCLFLFFSLSLCSLIFLPLPFFLFLVAISLIFSLSILSNSSYPHQFFLPFRIPLNMSSSFCFDHILTSSVSPHSVYPLTVSTHSVYPLTISSHSVYPLTVSSHSVYPLTVSSHSVYPLTVSSQSVYPLTVSSHSVYPLTVSSHSVYPLTVSSHSVYPLTVTSHSLYPLTLLSCFHCFHFFSFILSWPLAACGFCPFQVRLDLFMCAFRTSLYNISPL